MSEEPRSIGIEEARAKLGDLVDLARISGTTTLITRHGRPVAAITPLPAAYAADGPDERAGGTTDGR